MTKSNFFLTNMGPSPMMFTLIILIMINSLNNFSWNIQKVEIMVMFIMFFFLYLNIFFMKTLINENMFMGYSSFKKKMMLSNGFLLFILSELMIFISLFWSYIHNAYTPNILMGNFWPPKGLIPANPTSMIIFGSTILLSSSMIIMVSHSNMIIKNNKTKSSFYMHICIIMGILFIDMQILEMSNFFMKLNFNFNDSIFSSSFLFTTSLHASHVVIGLMGLIYSLNLLKNNFNSNFLYMNFEFSIWYWHFVDYIWIIVFTLFYYFNN